MLAAVPGVVFDAVLVFVVVAVAGCALESVEVLGSPEAAAVDVPLLTSQGLGRGTDMLK